MGAHVRLWGHGIARTPSPGGDLAWHHHGQASIHGVVQTRASEPDTQKTDPLPPQTKLPLEFLNNGRWGVPNRQPSRLPNNQTRGHTGN